MAHQRHCLLGMRTLTFLFLFVAFLTGPDSAIHAGGRKAEKVPVPGAVSGNYGLQYERSILTGIGLDDVFEFNSTFTTEFGPAYANIFSVGPPTSFLECKPPQGGDFSYALCYYSGPDFPTGISDNPALPCTLTPDGKIADCTCYELNNVALPTTPYYVDINAISNLAVYNETIAVCGTDGSGCVPNDGGVVAPVCNAINANLLVPGADLISVFSPVKKLDYFAGTTVCDAEGSLYAGCMTSPCYSTGEQDANGAWKHSQIGPVFATAINLHLLQLESVDSRIGKSCLVLQTNGAAYAGQLLAVDQDTITLRDASGKIRIIRKDAIEEFRETPSVP